MTASSGPGPSKVLVATFYRFVSLPDRRELRQRLRRAATERDLLGTILLAAEGINGTLAGRAEDVRSMLAELCLEPRFAGLEARESWADEPPFHRLRVRLKREIITLGCPDLDPGSQAGTYVAPRDWNALVDDPRVVLIDTRNDYETVIGTFEGAIDPKTESFGDFPAWLEDQPALEGKPPVAMFCTGGIRCEKATALLRSAGFEEVYHLQGGILRYLEEVEPEESRWQGECFVFDQRVAVAHGLEPGSHDLCFACRWPVSAADRASDLFEPGVTCPRCHDSWTPVQLQRFRTRQRQMVLAAARGERHLGRVCPSSGAEAQGNRGPTGS